MAKYADASGVGELGGFGFVGVVVCAGGIADYKKAGARVGSAERLKIFLGGCKR